MNTQENAKSVRGVKKIVIMASLVLLVLYTIMSYNDMNGRDIDIPMRQKDAQNALSNMINKARDNNVITKDQDELFKLAVMSVAEGRKGLAGVFTALSESQVGAKIPDALRTRMMQEMNADYNTFERNQKIVLDYCAAQRKATTGFPGVIVAGIFGFPRIDLEKYETLVLAPAAKGAYETGEFGGVFGGDSGR